MTRPTNEAVAVHWYREVQGVPNATVERCVEAYEAAQCYDDGSCPLNWALVQYGDDDLDNRLVMDDSNDEEPTDG